MSLTILAPWKPTVQSRIVGSMLSGHTVATELCLVCRRRIGNKPSHLVALGPDTERGKQLHAAGKRYLARVAPGHRSCVEWTAPEDLTQIAQDTLRLITGR